MEETPCRLTEEVVFAMTVVPIRRLNDCKRSTEGLRRVSLEDVYR